MWCSACQQDVPGVAASREDRTLCCARCGESLTSAPHSSAWDVPFEELPEFGELSDWSLDETLQDAEHLVRSIATDAGRAPQQTAWCASRGPKYVRAGGEAAAWEPSAEANSPISASRLVLAAALAVFVCGVALISLAVVSQRPFLWQLGIPLALAGQVAVLAVVVWQLNAAWNGNRATGVARHAVDDQVGGLRGEWPKTQHSNRDAFYDHLAEGAGPETLLADLKDQLEVLSEYLDETKRAA